MLRVAEVSRARCVEIPESCADGIDEMFETDTIILTSHLRAMRCSRQMCRMDKADLRKCKLMNELADPELTAVYVESQNKERHDSFVTLTAPELVFATRHNEVVPL